MSTSGASPRSALTRVGSLSLLAVAAWLVTGCSNPPPHPLLDPYAPTAAPVGPAPGDSLVRADTVVIEVRFSEPMDCATVEDAMFVTTTGGAVAGNVTCHGDGMDATFTPSTALVDGMTYTVTITRGAQDLAGNPLAAPTVWSFTTDPFPAAPTVEPYGPFNGDPQVAVTSVIRARFSEPMNCATVNGTTFTLRDGGVRVAGNAACADAEATFTPEAALTAGTTYTVTVTTGAKDRTGDPLATDASWSFTTDPGLATSIVGAGIVLLREEPPPATGLGGGGVTISR